MSFQIPPCVFCGHPTLVFNTTLQKRVCPVCQRKLDIGIKLDYDLFSQTNKYNKE